MASKREIVLQTLFARLSTIAGPKLLRNDDVPERIPPGGVLILRDGDPGEPEVLLSPREYVYQHRAEIEVIVDRPVPAQRDAVFDSLLSAVGGIITGNRTLGGLCDFIEAESPEPIDLGVEGAPALKAAVLPVVLHYGVPDPLSQSNVTPVDPGTDEALAHMLIAAQNISALRVIARDDDGLAIYADHNDEGTINAIAGVSRNAAAIGEAVHITTMGTFSDDAWNWNMEADPALFLGANGAITQGPTPGVATVRIGLAVGPQTMLVRLGEPVINA